MTGIFMASGLSKRVSGIENAVALLAHIHDRMRFLSPTVGGLVESACGVGKLRGVAYLTVCREQMGRGVPFPTAWREAVWQYPGSLGAEEAALMASLSEVLGSSDLESQLNAVAYTRSRMEELLEQSREYRRKHQKLYGSLGILTGLAIVILLV